MQQSYRAMNSSQQVSLIPIEQIVLRQDPSVAGDEGMSIRALAASIRKDGLIQPITVRPRTDGRYIVVSGNRRLLACRMCGFSRIEAVVLPGDAQSDAVRQLMDLLFSGALDYLDEAEAIHRLCVQGSMEQSVLARRLGIPESTVAQRLQLMQLSAPLRSLLQNHHMPSHIAYALLNVPDEDTRMAIARQAARQHLSIADVDLLISSALRHPSDAAQPIMQPDQAQAEASHSPTTPLQPLAAAYAAQTNQLVTPSVLDVPAAAAASKTDLPLADAEQPSAPAQEKASADQQDAALHGRTISVMRDERLYLNAIRALVSQMQEAGLHAQIAETSYGSSVEMTIQLPMTRHRRSDKYRMPVSSGAAVHSASM